MAVNYMLKNNVRFSIHVPVYNAERFLTRCIDSLLAQTFKSFEIILTDDGSTDNSGRICDAYAEKDACDNGIEVGSTLRFGIYSWWSVCK